MDAQYPFASRDDIWRVFDELKELHLTQFEQGERLAQLERRRDEDARLRSPWASASPFPTSVGAITPGSPVLPSGISSPLNKPIIIDPAFHSPPDAFKGFDQAHPSTMTNSAVGFDGDDEPRRGASRANSVRFDESALHGYGHTNRNSSDLPSRTGSGLSSHPLLERTFSHQSDGRLSSSGYSHQSARTNSLRLNTARLSGSTPIESPLIPPPGLFLLGPVPSIIRCWLTEDFTNGSLLYAAVCTGSYFSSVSLSMIRNLGMEDLIVREDDVHYIKLPLYLPEAVIHPCSSRPETPTHQVPAVPVRFVIREGEPTDQSIQIIIGSDVLRAQNADILFSQDKLIMVDSEHYRISVPLVRPENDTVFKNLYTAPCTSGSLSGSVTSQSSSDNGNTPVGVIGRPINSQEEPAPSSKTPSGGIDSNSKPSQTAQPSPVKAPTSENRPVTTSAPTSETKEDIPTWSSWRREAKRTYTAPKPDKREMKVFRPAKLTNRAYSSTSTSTSAGPSFENAKSPPATPHPTTSPGKGLNPVGGASAFGWLNPALNPVTRGV
ncbi:unnamed protein product [Penicillium salamii]|uniref:Ubiquitin carboxyl-terminal hydrolase 19 n=1 Tax=Penicillium salamii TaxID=1612424 RepID=A0A9W4NPJ0_9EURO|nr:unnamed protein product [Penicillium salamii]CAG8205944.1 unnamed protein product [Penicillium salamii]CAG8364329.1 unnamed protein product [Penicillium salamii]CAG8368508.1 unnamed protein product [Penicillium salamii]CAG8397707.1 unnamed protein product [Penicillium salamii]